MKKEYEPMLLPFRRVQVNIPRKFILKRLRGWDYLNRKDTRKIERKLKQIEKAQNRLAHAKSLVEKVLLKGQGKGGKPYHNLYSGR